jgi:hypothetical protein
MTVTDPLDYGLIRAITDQDRIDALNRILEEKNREISIMTDHITVIAESLHNKDCYNNKELIVGQPCCQTNQWVRHTLKISECIIYMYKQIEAAPHDKNCNRMTVGNIIKGMTLPIKCTCYNKRTLDAVHNFLVSIVGD